MKTDPSNFHESAYRPAIPVEWRMILRKAAADKDWLPDDL
jgi:hypothetical protein